MRRYRLIALAALLGAGAIASGDVPPGVTTAMAITAPARSVDPVPPTDVARAATGPAPTTLLDNPFIPESVNLSECISALPRPGCGSEARGGWRQTLVFAVLFVGMLLIALRLVIALRRRQQTSR